MRITRTTSAAVTPSPTQVPGVTTAVPQATTSPPTGPRSAPAAPVAAPSSQVVTTTSSTVPSAPPVTSHGKSGGDAALTFASVVVGALIVASWNLWLAWRKSREEECSRQRTAFADALRAIAQYKEMPYAIRRRDKTNLPSERVRLSEVVRTIQADLTYHQTWIRSESESVGKAYDALVTETRKVAGIAMRDAWIAKPIVRDDQMNIGPELVDLRSLTPFEKAYTQAVSEHLAVITSSRLARARSWFWAKLRR